MSDIEITITLANPKMLSAMLEIAGSFGEVGLSGPLIDTLTILFSCDDESKAPVLQRIKVKNLKISFPTTFFPTPKSVACMIGKEVVRIGGRDGQEARRIIVARFQKQGLSVPPEIYKEALGEAIVFDLPKGCIEIRGEYKTRHIADVLGIEPQSVRYHLRNLLSEGVDIGSGKLWETTEEFERICNLIKPRLGAHGRRA